MSTTLWILQGLVATALITSGFIIMLMPKEKLTPKILNSIIITIFKIKQNEHKF